MQLDSSLLRDARDQEGQEQLSGSILAPLQARRGRWMVLACCLPASQDHKAHDTSPHFAWRHRPAPRRSIGLSDLALLGAVRSAGASAERMIFIP